MILRPYQQRAIDDVVAHLDRRPVLVLPTGGGKTVTACSLIQQLGRPTLWVVHRRELVVQARDTLRALGVDAGVILAGHQPEPWHRCQVASIQTLARREHPPADLIVVDEAHHIRASTYLKVLEQYPGVPVLGLTATPFRTDGRGLGDVFGHLTVGAYPMDLIDDGVLIEPTVYAPTAPDLSGVHVRSGEYRADEAYEVMHQRKIVGDVLEHWQRHAAGRRTVLFGVNRAHTHELVIAFQGIGVRAEYVDGTTSRAQRDATLYRLRLGYTTVVGNCMILTEGWDLPALEVAVVARPTASLCLHIQMIGRIMRAASGKSGALVLDHAGNHLRHGMVTERLHYTLDDVMPVGGGGTGAANPSAGRRCLTCYLLSPPGAAVCRACGTAFPVTAKPVEHEDGELEELRREAVRKGSDEEHNARTIFERIERTRVARGYKPGWTAFRMKARYGDAAFRLMNRFRKEQREAS